ncbi:SprT family zinc-dependent metalloprotease [Alteromonas sp. ASW11-130]|uniref:SprT family zinc-dependent metalloprotease n=1 Tax=Alteromonas sp. ASW11-130 TaxID=3015775 RepID=UPI0022422094|nr:SprT family zinc-dependent metalloprotease [Alteromonas sp. ASW11-130]MCW8092060.1 SprT family zinc-dependent metalloprotease [Alteromonas sp. ASW11-130]
MPGKITLSQEQIDLVHQRTQELMHQASVYFQQAFPPPSISFRRSGKNAGTAFLQQNRINFNPVLLVENWQEYIDHVIPHEVAHLVVFQVYGRKRFIQTGLWRKQSVTVKPHGEEWRNVMEAVFGAKATTTHNFNLSSLGMKTFAYTCGCQKLEVTIRRHNRIEKGATYRCKRCHQELVRC